MPLALVTCGPAHEPIDDVRRITNHSTGEIGTILSETLSASGFEILCLRGEMAGHPAPKNASVVAFSTNASLLKILQTLPVQPAVVPCRLEVRRRVGRLLEGTERARKIRSTVGELHLILRPAEKILPRLRSLFPDSIIVGWKYELDGSCANAIARAREQIKNSRTNACVVNGSAYGTGFGFLTRESEELPHFADKSELCAFLATWTSETVKRCQTSAKGDPIRPSQAGRSA